MLSRFFKKVFPVLLLAVSLNACTYYFGKNRLPLGANFDPELEVRTFEQTFRMKKDFDNEHPLIDHWASMPIPDWETHGKVRAPRVLIARLLKEQDIEEVNAYLLEQEPWGRSGTNWMLNPRGDYDFTEIPLLILLYKFKDKPDLLFPETQEHIVHTLLTHSGNRPALKTPRTLKLMRETENHILMGETSRYLKNQWVYQETNDPYYNNIENGHEAWMLNHLDELLRGGFFEFNSLPYLGYSLNALLTLHAFAESEKIQLAVEKILNQKLVEYAYGSLQLRRYPPFRRQLSREAVRDFNQDPLTAMVRLWKELYTGEPVSERSFLQHFTFPALILNYRPAPQLIEKIVSPEEKYLVRIGHGHRSTPEIYSGGPGYVLSAGGAQRGRVSQIVARPVTLFLEDQVQTIDSCFHIPGRGPMKRWNNTCVYKGFACGNHPVQVPPQYRPMTATAGWKVFETPQKDMYVVVYNALDFGLLFIAYEEEKNANEILAKIMRKNQGMQLNREAVTFEGDTIRYRLNASARREVIRSVNQEDRGVPLADFPRFEKILFEDTDVSLE